jgi:hypothetical protein
MSRIQNEDIKSSAQLISGGGTAAQLPNDDKIYVTANSINKTLKQAIIDEDIGAPPVCNKESKTLTGTNITNGYVDLSFEALAESLMVISNRMVLIEGVDYSLSIVSLVTRVTFSGDFALGGNSELQQNDILYFQYIVA